MKKPNSHWATNLKRLRERKNWTQDELAEKLGITRGKLALQESGRTINPPVDDLICFSNFFNISVDTLLKTDLRKVSELKIRELESGNDSFATGSRIRVLATTVDADNNERTELVPIKAKAGYRAGFADPQFISELPRFSIPGLPRHRKHRIFPISGDSMLPYPDGCYIVGQYVEDWLSLKDDTLCILILKSGGDDFVFKQIENRIKKERKLVAHSLNPLYAPYDIPVKDVLEIWQYQLHLSDKITPATGDITMEQVLPILQEMRLELNRLSKKVGS